MDNNGTGWSRQRQGTMNYYHSEQFLSMQQGALRRDDNRAEDTTEMRTTMMGMGHWQWQQEGWWNEARDRVDRDNTKQQGPLRCVYDMLMTGATYSYFFCPPHILCEEGLLCILYSIFITKYMFLWFLLFHLNISLNTSLISLLTLLGSPLSIDKQLSSKISMNKEKLSRFSKWPYLFQGKFPYFKEHLHNENLLNPA